MKKIFTIMFLILGGIVGSAIGDMCKYIDGVNWLSLGGQVGFENPVVVDLSFLQFTFGIWCKINVAGILCLLLAAYFSHRVFKWLKI